MATRTDFNDDEWDALTHAPPGAGLVVMIAQSGGTIRETTAIARVYSATREDAEVTGLMAEIIAEQPEIDSPRSSSPEELQQLNLDRLRDARDLLIERGTESERQQYAAFTMMIAEQVAHAHRGGFLGWGGDEVSVAERDAIERVRAVLEGG